MPTNEPIDEQPEVDVDRLRAEAVAFVAQVVEPGLRRKPWGSKTMSAEERVARLEVLSEAVHEEAAQQFAEMLAAAPHGQQGPLLGRLAPMLGLGTAQSVINRLDRQLKRTKVLRRAAENAAEG